MNDSISSGRQPAVSEIAFQPYLDLFEEDEARAPDGEVQETTDLFAASE